MRKIILAIALTFTLGGCANLQLLTQNYSNPITKETLYDVENGLIVAFAGLNVYKKSCRAGTLPVGQASCDATVGRIQVYTRQLRPLLAQLRTFVKQNDQVNARVVYMAITGLVAGFREEAARSNVVLGGK